MNATTLDLATMRERRMALEDDLKTAETALADAQAGLVIGSTKAAQVVNAQNLVGALEGALATLGARIGEAEQEAAAEQARARREAALGELVALASDATAHRERLLGLTQEAIAALEPIFAAMSEEVSAWGSARSAWVSGAVSLAPGLRQRPYGNSPWAVPGEAETAERLMRELGERGDLSAVLTRVFSLTPETVRDNTALLALPDDALALPLFNLFKRYHVRKTQNHLDL